jgi:hypothetical protein
MAQWGSDGRGKNATVAAVLTDIAENPLKMCNLTLTSTKSFQGSMWFPGRIVFHRRRSMPRILYRYFF